MTTQDIQFNIDFSTGQHSNTIFKNGRLQLQEIGVDNLNQIVYVDSGYWVSDIIQFADKFKEYKPFQFTLEQDTGTSYKISVSSSDDLITWSDYIEIDDQNTISNQVSNYIRIKIELFASKNLSEMLVDHSKYENNFVNISNGLRIKRDYDYDMALDSNWNEEGSLHRRKITRNDWTRVDRLNVRKLVR